MQPTNVGYPARSLGNPLARRHRHRTGARTRPRGVPPGQRARSARRSSVAQGLGRTVRQRPDCTSRIGAGVLGNSAYHLPLAGEPIAVRAVRLPSWLASVKTQASSTVPSRRRPSWSRSGGVTPCPGGASDVQRRGPPVKARGARRLHLQPARITKGAFRPPSQSCPPCPAWREDAPSCPSMPTAKPRALRFAHSTALSRRLGIGSAPRRVRRFGLFLRVPGNRSAGSTGSTSTSARLCAGPAGAVSCGALCRVRRGSGLLLPYGSSLKQGSR